MKKTRAAITRGDLLYFTRKNTEFHYDARVPFPSHVPQYESWYYVSNVTIAKNPVYTLQKYQMTVEVEDIVNDVEHVCTDTSLFMSSGGSILYRVGDKVHNIGQYTFDQSDAPPYPTTRLFVHFYRFCREYWKHRSTDDVLCEEITKTNHYEWLTALRNNKGHLFIPPRTVYHP